MNRINCLIVFLLILKFSYRAQKPETIKPILYDIEEFDKLSSLEQMLKYNTDCRAGSYELNYLKSGKMQNVLANFKDLQELKDKMKNADHKTKIRISVFYKCMGKNETKNFIIEIKREKK